MQTLTISLPEKIYRRLKHAAASAGRSVHELAAQSVQETLPPLFDVIPAPYRQDLRTLEKLSDEKLKVIAHGNVEVKLQKQLHRLLLKNSAGILTTSERKALAALRSSADLVMLRKAYAFLLLKWRAHRIPSLADLENGT